MKWEERNLSKSYILSGRNCFFHRYCDSGFKTKWTGLWGDSKKFLDYFAFKVDGTWLSPNNCYMVEYDEAVCIHNYSLDGIEAKEILFVPENGKILFVTLQIVNRKLKERRVRIELEVGVNIREMEENWHERKYQYKLFQHAVIVDSSKGTLIYGADYPFSFRTLSIYRDHYPGELERCFIPGILYMDTPIKPEAAVKVNFAFACGENRREAYLNFKLGSGHVDQRLTEKRRRYLEVLDGALLRTGIKDIDELFRWSVLGLEKLIHRSSVGLGVFAGYPWFTQYWGRDSGWVIPAIIDYGNFEDACEALRTLADFQSDEGEIPNLIHLYHGASYGSSDATPLWIISLAHYVLNSGDIKFLREYEDDLMRAIEWCRTRDINGDGLLETDNRYTWMDTLERRGAPVDLQAIWFKTLTDAKNLLNILGVKGVDPLEIKSLKNRIEEEFWNEKEGFYYDRVKDGEKSNIKTVNSIFPVLFGVSREPLRVIEKLEGEEFTGAFGIRTLSKNEPTFNPAGYHTGSAWGWINGLMASIEFLYGRADMGLKYLSILKSVFGRNCICSLDEAWNADNADPTLLKGYGREPSAVFQAWSFGSIIRCIDEYMLGLRIDALNRRIEVSASLKDGMEITRRKRIGNDLVDLKIKQTNGKVKVNYVSRGGSKYRLTINN